MAKVWITKYALTQGIFEAEGKVFSGEYFDIGCRDGLFTKNEWHHTKSEAIARAEEMRIAKLKSLDKQIKKISALKFE